MHFPCMPNCFFFFRYGTLSIYCQMLVHLTMEKVSVSWGRQPFDPSDPRSCRNVSKQVYCLPRDPRMMSSLTRQASYLLRTADTSEAEPPWQEDQGWPSQKVVKQRGHMTGKGRWPSLRPVHWEEVKLLHQLRDDLWLFCTVFKDVITLSSFSVYNIKIIIILFKIVAESSYHILTFSFHKIIIIEGYLEK